MSIVLVGSMQTMSVSLNSGKVIQSLLSENDLKMALTNLILDEDSCKENLKPGGGLTETTPDKGIGTVSVLKKYDGGSCSDPAHTTKADCEGASETWNASGGIDIFTSGEKFNNSLDIIAIRLSGDDTEDPLLGEVQRTLTVYYKKPGLGKLSTLGGRETGNPNCTASNQDDCYFKQCDIEYKTDNSSGSTEVAACKALNCFSNEILLAQSVKESRYCILVDCYSCGCLQWGDQYLPDGTPAIARAFRRKYVFTYTSGLYYNPGYSHNPVTSQARGVDYLYYNTAKTVSSNPSNDRSAGTGKLITQGYLGGSSAVVSGFGKQCCPATYGRDYL